MNISQTTLRPRAFSRVISAILAAFSPALVLTLTIQTSDAGSATWNVNPVSDDWNTAENWTPASAPNGDDDTATFATSNITSVDFSGFTILDGIDFSFGADAFTLDVGSSLVEIVGTGIRNKSGITQTFLIPVEGIIFTHHARVGSQINFTMEGGSFGSAFVVFTDHSRAGSGTYLCKGAALNQTQGGYVAFEDGPSSADHGTFTIEGASVRRAAGAFTFFRERASAGFGVFRIGGAMVAGAGAGTCTFFDSATAENGTFILRGGLVSGAEGSVMTFYTDSTGGRARVQLLGNSTLDISGHNAPGMTIGSIAGDGTVSLGANTLSVGENNVNTTFSGLIRNGDSAPGGLAKIGTGRLSLISANTYTRGTTVESGALLVGNASGSATGTGPVQVAGGTLGGTGTIGGAVTVATGSSAAFLAPGSGNASGTLTIQNDLTFNPLATCDVKLDSTAATADKAVAIGVTIESGAQISIADSSSTVLPQGTVFTIIDNTAATTIGGTFSNLADGVTVTVGSNTFQADYQGGDGNDLTLTVVP